MEGYTYRITKCCMTSSLVQLLAFEKLNGDNYAAWKSNLNMILVMDDLSIYDVLAKKHDVVRTAKEIMESLRGMFAQPSFSLRHDAIKYVYNCRMKEGTSVKEHVLNMMVHFNVTEINRAIIDDKSQVSFILESLSKSFLQFRTKR
ncbi:uncharacterized protein LOC120083930 [Benincasa hispida]|uniref:uncharacterized protein LOC120083930 n=1 Tax=Benincasa hispida TaxID=102211 RepID=UPI0019028229|nr:uncharacterized protein LOC120083930 [Benincasa hispida]